MSQEYIEITEKTVDDAITTACQRLSVTSSRLDYIVVQREKSGFLGIGAKPAIIKARVKDAADATQAILDDVLNKAEKKVSRESGEKKNVTKSFSETKGSSGSKPSQDAGRKNNVRKTDVTKSVKKTEETKSKNVQKAASSSAENTEKKETKNSSNNNRRRRNNRKPSGTRRVEGTEVSVSSDSGNTKEKESVKKTSSRRRSEIPDLTEENIAEIKQTADQFLKDVFKAMDMEVEISEDYDKEAGILTVDMEGEDMGVLIGKRGQTLDSLQYLVSLVVNKNVDGYIHVKADTENYRERRKKTLENLAVNIAQKVKRTRHSVALEPMNPYERRIIHSALQSDKYVTTYSEGEEPYRKVIVDLRKDEKGEILLPESYGERNSRSRNGRGGRNSRSRNDRRGRNDSSRTRRERRDAADSANDSGEGVSMDNSMDISMEMVDEIIAEQNAAKAEDTASSSAAEESKQ